MSMRPELSSNLLPFQQRIIFNVSHAHVNCDRCLVSNITGMINTEEHFQFHFLLWHQSKLGLNLSSVHSQIKHFIQHTPQIQVLFSLAYPVAIVPIAENQAPTMHNVKCLLKQVEQNNLFLKQQLKVQSSTSNPMYKAGDSYSMRVKMELLSVALGAWF